MHPRSFLQVGTLLAGVVLGACASSGSDAPADVRGLRLPTATAFDGGPREFANQATSVRDTLVVGDPSRIWAVLPEVLALLDVESAMRDPATLVIGTRAWRTSRIGGTRLSEYLDCGGGVGGPNADNYDVTLSLFVQLDGAGAGSTVVRTVIDASAQSRYNLGDQLQCASFGTLERRVVALIGQRLAASAGALAGPLRRAAAGDFVRVACAAEAAAAGTREGALLGVRDGALLLDAGGMGGTASVPVASVARLEVRDQRRRTRVSALLGAGLGMVGGALLGRSMYDPNSETHYQPEVFAVVGAVLGTAGGAGLGAIVGTFLRHDVWVAAELAPELVPPAATPPRVAAGEACAAATAP